MKSSAPGTFGTQLRALREAAGFTQEELATIAGLSVHAVSALERGERRRPQVDTIRALSAALDLTGPTRELLLRTARTHTAESEQFRRVSMPLAPTALVGREDDLKVLGEWLEDRSVRLITLTGPGGAGKTRLALELARRVTATGTARVLFVPLETTRDASSVASAIAEALGLLDINALDLPRRAKAACGGSPTLLLLDNFEQVLVAAPLVAEILSSADSLRVLATSRAALQIRGEREYVLGSLAVEMETVQPSFDEPGNAPAVQLFLDRVQDVQPGFRLTTANRPTITAICRRLDALPLALELAAPWLKVLPPDDLLARLSLEGPLPATGARDLPERQQTMNSTVAWSYQLLDRSEQHLFRRLGVIPARFSIDAAAAVLANTEDSESGQGDALDGIARLVNKSLLARAETSSPTRPLYRMLETVRAFAALELDRSGERNTAMQGLARYCVREGTAATSGLVGPAQGEWLNRVRDDLDNYRRAMSWLLHENRTADAVGIAYGLLTFWVIRGHSGEGLDWCERALALPELSPRVECRALVGGAMMQYTLGRLDGARAALARALALNPGEDNIDCLSWAELTLGHVEHAAGNEAAAEDWFDRSLVDSRRAGMAWLIGNALAGKAWVALATGKLEETERLLDEALAAFEAPVRGT
jgi:predicted ATPase/transcriptional regulator with XRE-family HTH domain